MNSKVSGTAFPATCIYCKVIALPHHATRMKHLYYCGTHAINMHIHTRFGYVVIRFFLIILLIQNIGKYT